jgi:hypothetical protein
MEPWFVNRGRVRSRFLTSPTSGIVRGLTVATGGFLIKLQYSRVLPAIRLLVNTSHVRVFIRRYQAQIHSIVFSLHGSPGSSAESTEGGLCSILM